MAYPHVPFPVNVSLSDSLFHAAPFTSNSSSGWTSDCTSPECGETAVWKTGAPNSTLAFTFWGWDVAFDGTVQGDMGLQIVLDGKQMAMNSENGTLFTIKDLDNLFEHSLLLTVQNASAGSLLSVNQARINASTYSDSLHPFTQWDLPTNDGAITYAGFTQQPSIAGSISPTTYTSSAIGDTASITFNGSTIIVYGPCGPTSGLISVSLDDQTRSVNTSTPIASNNCILYQSKGYPALTMHKLSVVNEDGRPLSINHLSFFRILEHQVKDSGATPGAIAGGVIGGLLFIAIGITMYSLRSRKTRQKINKSFSLLCS